MAGLIIFYLLLARMPTPFQNTLEHSGGAAWRPGILSDSLAVNEGIRKFYAVIPAQIPK